MDGATRNAIRLLKAYGIATTTLLIVLALAAFRQTTQKPRFEEIDVERINVVEKDGTLRLTISNRARMPDPVIGGKSFPLRGGSGAGSAGFIFFNDRGDEMGGLAYQGAQTDHGYRASEFLSFDQREQNEAVTLYHGEQDGQRGAGLQINDQPDVSIKAMAESLTVIRQLPDGPEKTRRSAQLREGMVKRGEVGMPRLFVGKSGKAANMVLSDPQGRPRLRLMVDSLGAAKIEFLDEGGRVVQRIPEQKP
jgi:hypothetical protein